MNLDISTEDIRTKFKTRQQTISSLHNQGKAKKAEFSALKKEQETLIGQMGWREKYLMGLFGGDNSVVQKMKSIKDTINKTKNILIDIDKKIKFENDNLLKEIKDYLINHSDSYQRLSKENDCHVDLYNASAKFYNFLVKAKKTITDALLLTSWNGLLEHPKAKEGLNTFRTLTAEYQKQVDLYEKTLKVNLLNGDKLEDYIKFSSQSVAMDSFNRIATQVKNNISYTDTKINEVKSLKEGMIEQIKRLTIPS